jgi:hypothetical protein
MLWAHKMWGVTLLAEVRLASQEGPYSMALISFFGGADGQWGDKRSSGILPSLKTDHVRMYLSACASLFQLHNICA